ncbi:MAG TPA: hypothetical protein VG076_16340 [Acidimicrobiales bacterium]|nr:hypothetical protein [Acidimicrobiales bacterium]
MTDVFTALPKLGACSDHLVIGLDDGEFGDAALEASPAEFSPPRSEHPEAQLHHGLECKEDRPGAYQDPILIGEHIGSVIQEPTDDHGVEDDAHGSGVGHASVSAS